LFQSFGVLQKVLDQRLGGAFFGGQAPKLGGQGRRAAGIQLRQGFPSGQNADLFAVLQPSLGLNIKLSQRIHAVAKKLCPDGPQSAGGKNIRNAPSDGKLASALHRQATDVTGGNQSVLQLFQRDFLVCRQGEGGLFQGLGRHGGHRQRFYRRRQHRLAGMDELIQRGQAPMLIFPGRALHIVEHILSSGQQGGGDAG
jgi:hypothetical protein